MKDVSSEKIRVLVADDSLFMRTYLTALFAFDSEIKLVGTASSGDDAILLAGELHPDVITMDYHMPGKNGVAAAAIMQGDNPLPAIIMLSAFAGSEGARAKRMLLASGAHVIEKPSGELSLDVEKIAKEILRKIKEVGRLQVIIRMAHERIRGGIASINLPSRSESSGGVIVIGASTGGPPLIEHLLSLLDPDAGQSVIIVQHMSKYFTELFAERLDRISGFHVREAVSGDILTPGIALVVPGGYTLVSYPRDLGICAVNVEVIPEDSGVMMIDRTMQTIANCFKGKIAGILLSGMGTDGTEGLRAIRAHGGLSLVQEPKTATVSAMPDHALREGAAQEPLALDDIPAHLAAYFANTPVSSVTPMI